MHAPPRRSLLRALCPAVLAVLAALAIAAAGCGDDEAEEPAAGAAPAAAAEPAAAPAKKQKTVRFVMPVPAGPDLAAYYVADDQFGAENGVKLEFDTQLIATQGAKKIMQDQADAFLGITTVLAVVNDAGLPLKYFRDDFVRNLTGFAVPADSDIRSIAQLKGKKIGIVDPGWPVVWDPIMRAAGLEPGDYEYKVVGVGNYQAMAAGKVDAVASWAMNWQPPDASIQKLRYLPGDALPAVAATPSNGVMVKADVLAEQPDWLVGLGRAISQAQVFMAANPECAAKIAETQVPSEQPFEVTLAQVREQIKYHRNEATEANGLGFSDPEAFDRMLADMKAGGVIKKDLKAADITDNSLVDEMNDFDVAEVEAKAKACEI